jgi:hypothetical protein
VTNGSELFVTGVIVEHLEKAMADLGATIGLGWTPVQSADFTLRIAGELHEVPLQFVYSLGEPPHIELIQAHDAGYYAIPAGPYIHHVGMWVDDLSVASQRLASSGMALEAAGVSGDVEPAIFAFHTNPHGTRIELVDKVMQPTFFEWVAGGQLQL